jgi:outer membrane protein OmpA-like peptidoglycan-associated protein
MPGAVWGIAVAALALLTACEQEQALQSGDPNYTMVFFATDSVTLNRRAQDTLTAAVKEPTPPVRAALLPKSKAKICVTGHSDRVGPDTINVEVARRRADAVAKYLVGLGVPEQRMVITSLGSSKPLVVTPPGTPEISNRRVEVVFGC